MQEALATRLEQATAAVEAVKQRLAESQTERKKIEAEVATIQTRLSKYKGQLTELKTNKEYQTMQHEIEVAEEAIRSHEDRVLERMEEAENLAARAEGGRGGAEDAAGGDRRRAEGARGGSRGAAGHGRRERRGARRRRPRQLSPEALKLFEHVSKQRKGLAVAEARDGGCTVCHVRMRPQMFNEVRRGENLIQCESCLRILYFVPQNAATQL